MKILSTLGTIIIILLIIAAITAPGDKKFESFIANDKGGDTMSCKPVINKPTEIKLLARIATVNYVNYCESTTQLNIKGKDGKLIKTNYYIPKVTHSETYLGLFGRFWKL